MAFAPAPDTAWYVDTTILLMGEISYKGFIATAIIIVEQLGFAIIPLCLNASLGLTSGTTSGISGSILKALLLSITTAPLSAAYVANSFDLEAPAEKSAISIFLKESFDSSFTSNCSFLNSIFFPADLSEARSTMTL